MPRLLFIFLFFLILISCSKEEDFNKYFRVEEIHSPANEEIKDILILESGDIFVCGGTKSNTGFICKSRNEGETWLSVFESESLSINSLFYSDSAGYWAAGDSISLWNSRDGLNWSKNPEAPCYWSNCRNPYYDMMVLGETSVFAVGGEYFQRGITSFSNNGVSYWIQLYWGNQLNDFYADKDNLYIAGYGLALKSSYDKNFEEFDDMKIYNDNFVKIDKNSDASLFMLGESGRVYKLKNDEWEEQVRFSGRYRDFSFNGKKALAVGDNGNTII